MTTPEKQSQQFTAADAILGQFYKPYRIDHRYDPKNDSFLNTRDGLRGRLEGIFQDDFYEHPLQPTLPRFITTVANGIAQAEPLVTETLGITFDLTPYLPQGWKPILKTQSRHPFALLAGRVGRDFLEDRDLARQEVAIQYASAYGDDTLHTLREETRDIITAIQTYVTNNDTLLFVSAGHHGKTIEILNTFINKAILSEFAHDNDFPLTLESNIITLRNTLTILQTTIQTKYGPWNNYTILMDPTDTLTNEWRHGDQQSNLQNDSVLLTVRDDPNEEDIIEILHTGPWFHRKRGQQFNIIVENPTNYVSVIHWLNTITRLGLPIVRKQFSTYSPSTLWSNTVRRIDIRTRLLLSLDLQRLIAIKPLGEKDDKNHRKEVFQQLASLIEIDPKTAIIILTITDFFPYLVMPTIWDKFASHKEFVSTFMDYMKSHNQESPTNSHAIVEAIREMRKELGSESLNFNTGLEGLIDLVDEMFGTQKYT